MSLATIVIWFDPSTNVRGKAKVPSAPTATGASLTVTAARWRSLAAPATVRSGRRVIRLSAGLVRATVGGWVSRSTTRSISVALPAASVATTARRFSPSISSDTPAARNERQPPAGAPRVAVTPATARLDVSSDARPSTVTTVASSSAPGAGLETST